MSLLHKSCYSTGGCRINGHEKTGDIAVCKNQTYGEWPTFPSDLLSPSDRGQNLFRESAARSVDFLGVLLELHVMVCSSLRAAIDLSRLRNLTELENHIGPNGALSWV